MNSRRFGRFTLPDNLVREQPYQVAQMLASIKFLPTRVQYLFHTEQFEYIGISEHFAEVEQGSEPPEYDFRSVYLDGQLCLTNFQFVPKFNDDVVVKSEPMFMPELYDCIVNDVPPESDDAIVVTIPTDY